VWQPWRHARTVSVFSDSEDAWRRTLEMARRHYEGLSGVTVLMIQDFGAQPSGRNPLSYKDLISQPAVESSGAETLPRQGRPIKIGQFILGHPAVETARRALSAGVLTRPSFEQQKRHILNG